MGHQEPKWRHLPTLTRTWVSRAGWRVNVDVSSGPFRVALKEGLKIHHGQDPRRPDLESRGFPPVGPGVSRDSKAWGTVVWLGPFARVVVAVGRLAGSASASGMTADAVPGTITLRCEQALGAWLRHANHLAVLPGARSNPTTPDVGLPPGAHAGAEAKDGPVLPSSQAHSLSRRRSTRVSRWGCPGGLALGQRGLVSSSGLASGPPGWLWSLR